MKRILHFPILVAALMEDLLIRGVMVRVLENWLGTYVTLVIAMLFEALHVFNGHASLMSVIFDLIWGFTMAMLYFYSKKAGEDHFRKAY